MGADKKASEVMSEKQKAQEALTQAQLAMAVKQTEAKASAEKLKGIMTKIGENSNDHNALEKLSVEAQSTKTEVMTTRAAAQEAAKAVAEKQQAMLKYTVKASEEEKKAEEEDEKVADEQAAEKAAEDEQPQPTPDRTWW